MQVQRQPKYDYSLAKKDLQTAVFANHIIRVICRVHGVFKVGYKDHKNGKGCQHCEDEFKDYNIELKEFFS